MLTETQRAQMLHAIGGKLHGGHRNGYMCNEPSETWELLVSEGLAGWNPHCNGGDSVVYHVTHAGMDRLRAEMPSDNRKAWEVKIGDSDPVVARAKSRSAARMTVVREFSDCWNTEVRDTLVRVRWCRRAPWADARGHHGRDELLTIEESRPPC